ncbi:MAG: PTS sugar transporter subunit IIA [Oceanospirillaceae bacterium]|nr:PTS sugar transporter subunit IIA [Oceanospirillaceae bacterium]
MPIIDLLSTQTVICDLKVGSKKRTLDQISTLVSNSADNISHDTIFTGLINRERLGSTGIGKGVAIPHCRLDDLKQPIGLFFKLSEAVDFDAIDTERVDLIFALVVPSDCCDEHLQTLAQLAELFSIDENRAALRQCSDSQALFDALKGMTS